MKTFKILAWLIGCLLTALTALAGNIIDLDHAVFRGDDESSFVEIYASIQREALIYRQHGDSLRADFYLILRITAEGETAVIDTFAGIDDLVSRDSLRAGQFFPHVFQYFMKPGDYSLRASLFQYGDHPEESIISSLKVRSFNKNNLQISDPQIGCNLTQTDETSPFIKNGIKILPNPTKFFGTDLPLFYYYLEVYNLAFDSTARDSLAIFREVLRADNDVPVRAEIRRVYKKNGDTAVLTDGFPIYTVPTGSYKLKLRVKDYATGQSVTAVKTFFCYRPGDFAYGRRPQVDESMRERLLTSSIDILEVIDPDSAVNLMRYLFTNKREEKRVKAYTQEGKRAFLHEFWSERERDDPGAANKHFARVALANQRYGSLNKLGWRTDRGRVLIMYGEPDNIVYRYEGASMPDHEIWQFDRLEGGVEFVFLDKSGFGNLELVHSTKRGEIVNPNWPSLSPSNVGNTNPGRLR